MLAMPRRTPARQLAAFLANLAETANFALAAKRAGLVKSGLYKRRARDPAFAADCAAALAHFRTVARADRVTAAAPTPDTDRYLTARGDLVLSSGPRRAAQIRRSPAGRLTPAGIACVLATLVETANVRLAAARAGIAASSIYARRDNHHAFAVLMDQALDVAMMRLEPALIAGGLRCLDPETAAAPWLEEVIDDAAALPLPPMHPDQVLWLLKFHHAATRIPIGYRRAPKGYRPNARALMTDAEVRAKLEQQMRVLAETARRDQAEHRARDPRDED